MKCIPDKRGSASQLTYHKLHYILCEQQGRAICCRMVERAERERRAAAVDAMRTEGTWARSRVEFKHYVDRAAEKAAVARALSHVLAA